MKIPCEAELPVNHVPLYGMVTFNYALFIEKKSNTIHSS